MVTTASLSFGEGNKSSKPAMVEHFLGSIQLFQVISQRCVHVAHSQQHVSKSWRRGQDAME
jgi:hypothetical protein